MTKIITQQHMICILMFNEALKDQAFLDIISMNSYTAKVTSADGTSYTPTWQATNYYSAGEATPPDGIHVYGGKPEQPIRQETV